MEEVGFGAAVAAAFDGLDAARRLAKSSTPITVRGPTLGSDSAWTSAIRVSRPMRTPIRPSTRDAAVIGSANVRPGSRGCHIVLGEPSVEFGNAARK
ncbi:hypothetical protein GCM10009678_59670 [Actinomadura kijaniata]